jgi:hypothetical protein
MVYTLFSGQEQSRTIPSHSHWLESQLVVETVLTMWKSYPALLGGSVISVYAHKYGDKENVLKHQQKQKVVKKIVPLPALRISLLQGSTTMDEDQEKSSNMEK